MSERQSPGGQSLLFLTDEQLRKGIEAMFFAYRGFTADPDRILNKYGYGRAHHRALHFISRAPGTTVNNLLSILGVTKQSLNRVLRTLIEDGLVESRVGTTYLSGTAVAARSIALKRRTTARPAGVSVAPPPRLPPGPPPSGRPTPRCGSMPSGWTG